MSTAIPVREAEARSATHRLRSLPSWTREPLLHFVILGAVLFVADHLIASRSDDPRMIVVDAAVDQQAIKVFKDARGRAPNEDELYALRKVWLDNEVLYREGLAMQLDKGDPAIRDRVIFKELSVIDASTKLPAFDDKILRAWFERNRVKYDEPARFDFQEAVLSGDKSESAVRAFVHALNAGTTPETEAGLRVFKGRPHSNLVQSYGEEFAKSLEALPANEWRALPSREGLRVVRLEATTPAKPGNFDDLRGVIQQDWTDATLAEQRSAAVRALTQKYSVQVKEAGK
ncbi:MAG: peptidyl-prolyl cis-trans isomerase [Povalibacter sp.]